MLVVFERFNFNLSDQICIYDITRQVTTDLNETLLDCLLILLKQSRVFP